MHRDEMGALEQQNRPMRRVMLAGIVLTCVLALPRHADAAPARFELYTIGPGDDVLTRFGHATLCLFSDDYPNGICFNYGVTRLRRAGLLPAVVLGRAVFWAEIKNYRYALRTYIAQDRDIYRQTLPLDAAQTARLATRLFRDARPEHREYFYDAFHDNCTTHLRDLLDEVTGGQLRAAGGEERLTLTYRRAAHDAYADRPLYLIGVDFVLGAGDAPLTTWDGMFLPDVLRASVTRALASAPEVIHRRASPLPPAHPGRGRSALLGLGALMFLALAVAGRRGGWVRLASLGLGALCLVVLSGLALAVLWSGVAEVRSNGMLLVYLPTDFLLLAGVVLARDDRPRLQRGLRWYLQLRLGLLAVLLLVVAGQGLRPSILPFVVLAAGLVGGSLAGTTHAAWRHAPQTSHRTRRRRVHTRTRTAEAR